VLTTNRVKTAITNAIKDFFMGPFLSKAIEQTSNIKKTTAKVNREKSVIVPMRGGSEEV
jgi:hypothetical protein